MTRKKGKCSVCGRMITIKIGVGPNAHGRGDLLWHKLKTKDWCPGSDEKPIEAHETAQLEERSRG